MTGAKDSGAFDGRYDQLERLGSGGFGEVFQARQRKTGKAVAIKVLQLRRGGSAADVERQIARFHREMELTASLHHPNIVPLIDSGQTPDDRLYTVFDFVPGRTLAEVLQSEGPLEARDACRLMGQVLDALACAHRNGVVHRDLKPANIMVTQSGVRRNAMVLDFGVGGYAREERSEGRRALTDTGEMIGTPAYSAPEQLRGEPPTPRADLYAWGLIFLECLTGRAAIAGTSLDEVLARQFSADPVPIPDALRFHTLGRLLATLTAKDPERRTTPIDSALDALERIDAEELAARLGAPREGTPPFVVRRLDGVGERRQVTFLSCRITLWRDSPEQMDVEECDELMRRLWGVCGAFAAGEDGYIASALGDRALMLFGFPQARENDALRATNVAQQIVEHTERESGRLAGERNLRLDVQVGIHTGLVIIRERAELIGSTAEAATQLDALARPGEILVSDATMRLLEGRVESEPRGEHLLGGISRPTPVFCLSRAERPLPAPGLETTLAQSAFVGRERELARLRDAWRQALDGVGQGVLIVGDAGIGKSRLLQEWRGELGADVLWLEARCAPESQNSPLQPVIHLLGRMLGEQPLDAVLERLGLAAEHHVPLFAALLSRPPDPRYPDCEATPQRRQELTLDAILALLFRIAEQRPLALAVEDLHWADATTQSLLEYLLQELRSAQVGRLGLSGAQEVRLAVLLTARSGFVPPWPLAELSVLQLRGLSTDEVRELARAVFDAVRPPRELLDAIALRADGVPLFVEQVSRMMLRAGPDPSALRKVEIPGTLLELLTARLDQLGLGARETAQLAAALGREFEYERLCAVAGRSDSELREDLGELIAAQLVHRSRRRHSFVFKHALVRDTAYASMLRSTRVAVHARIADTLASRFPDVREQQPELLAMHFEEGGQGARALDFRRAAGARATARWAHVEAAYQFGRALELLPLLPASSERDKLELELCTALGAELTATRGYGAEEVARAYGRARDLCRDLADIPLPVVYGIWVMTVTRGDRSGADELALWLEDFIARSSDRRQLLMAHASLGTRAMLAGELAQAEHHLGEAMARLDPREHESMVREYGGDGGLYGHLYMSWCLWYLGRRDAALANQARVLALTEQIADPYAIATALVFEIALGHDAGEPERVRAAAERTVALAEQESFPYWLALARCGLGWAAAMQGDPARGIAQIESGLELCRAIGSLVPYAYYSSYLVEALLEVGDLERALKEVDAALDHSGRHLDSFYEAELHRLRGEVLLRRSADRAAAEACFRQALRAARAKESRSLELRAAVSLARLQPAARGELAAAYAQFTEGLATRDLAEARALLEALT